MSIIDDIAVHEQTGALTRFEPRTRRPLRRCLFLTAEALRDLNDANSATNLLVGRGRIIAALERWVRGERVYAYGNNGTFLKRLKPPPHEVWEMKITEPIVQARLFCRFAYPNTLIMTRFHTRQMLGRRGSGQWEAAMRACEESWNQLFPSLAPFSANSPHEYITENCDDFDL